MSLIRDAARAPPVDYCALLPRQEARARVACLVRAIGQRIAHSLCQLTTSPPSAYASGKRTQPPFCCLFLLSFRPLSNQRGTLQEATLAKDTNTAKPHGGALLTRSRRLNGKWRFGSPYMHSVALFYKKHSRIYKAMFLLQKELFARPIAVRIFALR